MVNEILTLVDQYDLHVFPLAKGTKSPMEGFHWRQHSSNDLSQVLDWANQHPECNWAIDAGKSGLCILDIDNKKGKFGSLDLELLEAEQGEQIPVTFTVATPTGGEHYYYKGDSKNTAGKLGEGIDTRGEGGFVVAPYSVTPEGSYEITNEDALAELPQWISSRIGETLERDAKPSIYRDEPTDILDAVKFLISDAPESIEGNGGNNTAYTVACRVRDFGISFDTASRLMLDHYNPRCQPEWSEKDLDGIVRNAYNYAKLAAGDASAKSAFEGFNPETGDVLEVINAASLVGLPEEEPGFLFEDFIPKNEVSLMIGDGGTGKSQLVTQAAFAVAAGKDFMGMENQTQMPVIMVSCEDSVNVFQKRKYYIEREGGFAYENAAKDIYYIPRKGKSTVLGSVTGFKVQTTKFYRELDHYLGTIPGEKLLVLDTLADIFAGNENERSTVNQFVKYVLNSLVEKHQTTIVLIAHPPKSGSDYSGSTAWNNAVRARYTFKRPEENGKPNLQSNLRILETSKSNYSEVGMKVYMEFKHGVFVFDESNGQDFVDDISQGVSDMLFEHIKLAADNKTPFNDHHNAANPVFALEIRTKTGGFATKKEIQRALNSLISAGKVEKRARSKKGAGLYPINGFDSAPQLDALLT